MANPYRKQIRQSCVYGTFPHLMAVTTVQLHLNHKGFTNSYPHYLLVLSHKLKALRSDNVNWNSCIQKSITGRDQQKSSPAVLDKLILKLGEININFFCSLVDRQIKAQANGLSTYRASLLLSTTSFCNLPHHFSTTQGGETSHIKYQE